MYLFFFFAVIVSQLASAFTTSHNVLLPLYASDEQRRSASPLHVVSLTKSPTPGLGHAFIRALLQGGTAADNSALSERSTDDTANLTGADFGQSFLAPITFGDNGQTFSAVVDTGSSDTWIVARGFECFSPQGRRISEGGCGFGATYDFLHSSTFNLIQNENFAVSYGSGEQCIGAVGFENVTFAGVAVSQQEVGAVLQSQWSGDGQSSGIIGLAYPALTSAFRGHNPMHDTDQSWESYSPLFTTMYEQGLIEPVFSLEITEDGGTLTLGGYPTNYTESDLTSTPLIAIAMSSGANTPVNTTSKPSYGFYSIAVDGFQWGSNSTNDNATVIVDSGTTLNFVPTDVAEAVNLLFDPPANYDSYNGVYWVACNATAPTFSVTIAGTAFDMNPDDLVSNQGNGHCMSGVQDAGDIGVAILGDVFLKSVLAVFDVGGAQMRFAQR